MKLAIGTLLMLSVFVQFSQAQAGGSNPSGVEAPVTAPAAVPDPSPDNYTVFNATAEQEAALRAQIRQMHPDVLPLRVLFVSHGKYLAAARNFRLRVPTGYGSLMFTHLPSRTILIDNDRYLGEGWLGHWIAHERHLATTVQTKGMLKRPLTNFVGALKMPIKVPAFKRLRSAPPKARDEILDGLSAIRTLTRNGLRGNYSSKGRLAFTNLMMCSSTGVRFEGALFGWHTRGQLGQLGTKGVENAEEMA